MSEKQGEKPPEQLHKQPDKRRDHEGGPPGSGLNPGPLPQSPLARFNEAGPLAIIIVTRNESRHIESCLKAIAGFAPVFVVDSFSSDGTASIAAHHGARIFSFKWDGCYPKKRQWALDNLPLPGKWVLFIDADERITQGLKNEIARLFARGPEKDAYFIRSLHKVGSKICRYGFQNNKLVLFNREKVCFPVVDDLSCAGMGEIEGHYQPVPALPFERISTRRLRQPMIHLSLQDMPCWEERHRAYAKWAACMNLRGAWPLDPVPAREKLKKFLRVCPLEAEIKFFYSFILRTGFLDGRAGFEFALSRWRYGHLIRLKMRQNVKYTTGKPENHKDGRREKTSLNKGKQKTQRK